MKRTLKTKINQKTVDKIVDLVESIADDAYHTEPTDKDGIEQFLINVAVRLQMLETLIYGVKK